MTIPGDDQRNYFRVNETVSLEYVTVSENDVKHRQPETFLSSSPEFVLLRELQAIDHENNAIMRLIVDKEREVASYLKAINRKIDLLAQSIIDLSQDQNNGVKQSASLSEGGISFYTKDVMKKGEYVALKITLLPSYIGMMLFGRIVESPFNNNKKQYRNSIAFVALKEEDRHVLARHIIKVQSEAQRLRNSDMD